MFRKSKIEPVEKVKIVERYLAGEIGIVAAQNFCQNFSKLLTKLFGKYFRYL